MNRVSTRRWQDQFDQQLAGAMLGLHVLLLGRLNRHETHVRAAHCLTDRLGVVGIVLLAFHIPIVRTVFGKG